MPGYGNLMDRKFKIATAASKRLGYSSFKRGSKGYTRRSKIAEAVGKKLEGKK